MSAGRLIALILILGGLLFGALGGEFSVFDKRDLDRHIHAERATIDALTIEIDSLAAYADSIESDSVTQERVARERFGMLRRGEMLYRVER